MDTITQLYFEETLEQLAYAEGCLNDMQQHFQPAQVDGLFRYIHSVKGASDMMGFSEVTELAHVFEDLLSQLRSDESRFQDDLMDLCYQSVDLLLQMVENRKAEGHGVASVRLISESRGLMQQLRQFSAPSPSGRVLPFSTPPAPKRVLPSSSQPDTPSVSKPLFTESAPPLPATFTKAPPALTEEVSAMPDAPALGASDVPASDASLLDRFYVRLTLADDNPMKAVTRFLILKRLDENGQVAYACPSREAIESMNQALDASVDKALNPPMASAVTAPLDQAAAAGSQEMIFLFHTRLNRLALLRELDVGYVDDLFVVDLGKTYQDYRMTKDDRTFFHYYFREYVRILAALEQLSRQKHHDEPKNGDLHWQMIHYSLTKISARIVQLPSSERYHQWISAHRLAKDFFELEITTRQPKTPALITYLKNLLMHAATDAWRLVRNEVVVKHLQLEEKQHVLLTLQNLAMELNADLYQVLLLDISAKSRLLESEAKAILSVFQSLKEKNIRPLLVHDGKNRLRIDQGKEPLPLESLFVHYHNEQQLLEKALLQLIQHPFSQHPEGGIS